jgi:hypothetical protein
MPITSFPEYANTVTTLLDTLSASGQARLVNLQVDQRSMVRGFISGTLEFEDNSELHFREFLDLAQARPKVMYAYQYQAANGTLLFRYDNAAHASKSVSQEHKHTFEGAVPSPVPTLSQVLDEILDLMGSSKLSV